MSTPMMATEFGPIPDGFQVLDFTTAGTLDDKWSGVMPNAKHFIIQPIGAALNWRADGTDPTASVGMVLAADSYTIFENQPNLFKSCIWIGSSEVNVHLFG